MLAACAQVDFPLGPQVYEVGSTMLSTIVPLVYAYVGPDELSVACKL
jgi:hypothetical protein